MLKSDNTRFVIFEALYEYEPQRDGEITLKVGDQCWVQKPIDNDNGWLEGLNGRSKERGQFPGTYCKVLNRDANQPPLPPRNSKRKCISLIDP